MFRNILMAAPFMVAAGFAQAIEAPPAMKAFVENDVAVWANEAAVMDAVRAQNAVHADMTQARIDALDLEWRAQVGSDAKPLIDAVLGNPLSAFLKSQVDASGGQITEIFVMDAHGLNVASSGVTSDYWQGDEAKFQKTFLAGTGAMFVDDIELDESTQTYLGQVSIALTDPDTGEVIGAMTIGLNAQMFF